MFKFLQLTLTVILIHSVISQDADEEEIVCNQKSRVKMDKYFMHLTCFGDPNCQYPQSDSVMSDFCTDMTRYVNWAADYTKKCLRDTSKIVTNIMMTQAKSVVKKYCRANSKSRREYISWGKCGNSAHDDAQKCFTDFIFETQSVKNAPNEKIRIPLMCCHYHKFKNCYDGVLDDHDYKKKKCDENSKGGLSEIVDTVMYRALEFLCGEYRNNDDDKCKNIMHLTPLPVKSSGLPYTPLYTLIDVIDSIPPEKRLY